MGGSEEAPKFREETSKKQRKALHDRYDIPPSQLQHKPW
jgi:hypothetical protein